MFTQAKTNQALAAKGLETIELTESLAHAPGDSDARAALRDHLVEIRETAAELGFAHLESAVGAALEHLEREAFSPASVHAVRGLAQRYPELMATPTESGAHRVIKRAPSQGPTLHALVDEVTGAIRRGLLDSARGGVDAHLGAGKDTDVLAPVWKAIAELRALVEQRSGGDVRFEDVAGVPLLTLSGVVAPAEPHGDVRVEGRRVLVAGADSQVRWFYVGALREAGARVTEASDGAEALELARHEPPDVILADIVMPRLDGLALCAAVRREPALDGIPVVLLSWREDFRHRLQELRTGAGGDLRKELPAGQLLERVTSALTPLIELEAVLRSGTEVRGDLEELGVGMLFRAVSRWRPDTRVILQDPSRLFDVMVRGGHIVAVARTTIDGVVEHGAKTLPSLAGMGSGRFIVAEPRRARITDPEATALDGALKEVTRKLTETITAVTESPDATLELDSTALALYLRHSPRSVRSLVERLANGEPPRALWGSGGGSPAVVDALLISLARQGAIKAVVVPRASLEHGPLDETRGEQALARAQARRASEQNGDELSREDFRAQSAVSMHRQPVNRARRPGDTIWRLATERRSTPLESSTRSGFVLQRPRLPRVLGWGFIAFFAGMSLFLVSRPTLAPTDLQPRAATAHVARRDAPTEPPSRIDIGGEELSAHAGTLRPGVDRAFTPTASQGVLELFGPPEIGVHVDGVDQGPLPLALLLEQGHHVVRYRAGDIWTYRVYFVKAGATRVLQVRSRHGGFVDAR